jgi:hypothetical protein
MSEETFVRVLERRADDVRPRHLGFEDVRRSARRIQRRRRAAVAGGVAAAVAAAVLVPNALLGGSSTSEAPDPAPPSRSGHTAFLHDGQVTLPDGRTVDVDLDNRDVTQLGVLSDGRIVAATSRPQAIQVFSADGDLAAQYQVPVNALTMSPDDALVAWVDESGQVQVLESGVDEPVTLSAIPVPDETFLIVNAVTGSGCADGGCTAWGGDGSTTSAAATTDGPVDLSTSQPLRITDVSPDGQRWAVSFPPAPDEQFGCSAIYDVETDEVRADNCETSGLRFAPDGEHLIGMRGDNAMFGQVEVYDQELREVTVFDPPDRRVVKAAAWADDSHLLVVTSDLTAHPEWSLLRVPIDGGTPETVVGPVDGPNPESSSAFLLSE